MATSPAACSPTTLSGYRQVVTDYLVPDLGELRLEELDRRRIERLYGQLLDRVVVAARGWRPARSRTPTRCSTGR